LIGSDSLASTELHDFHVGDTYNPIEPSSVLPRLQTIGFRTITVVVDAKLSFIAHKPGGDAACGAKAPGSPDALDSEQDR
jgi:hypothetical protein